jgi:hypothetical protein
MPPRAREQAGVNQRVELWIEIAGSPRGGNESEVFCDVARHHAFALSVAVAFGTVNRREHQLVGDRLEPL